MSQRPCDKCGEMVSVTKAFCPACGHALVDEEARAETSEFEGLDGTMQLGKTMYNQMLSEMGLNISGPAEPVTEPVKPAVSQAATPTEAKPFQPVKAEVIRPISTETLMPAAPPAGTATKKDRTKLLLIIGGVILAGWVLVLVLLAFFAILPRLR